MTPNVSFALLDAAIIRGRADDPVVGAMTHARLLEEVAALGGVVWHLGVRPGLPVVIDLEDDLDAVVAALAASRIGGIVTTQDDPEAPVALVSSGSPVSPEGRVRIVRGEGVEEPDLEWESDAARRSRGPRGGRGARPRLGVLAGAERRRADRGAGRLGRAVRRRGAPPPAPGLRSRGSVAEGGWDTGPVSERRDIVILGSTGSIGTQALDVVRANPDRFRVVGLTAGGSQEQLFEEQVAEFSPARSGLGEDASTEAAGMACDVVLNGITGAVGLRPTVAALESGNVLALANKESLIIGGPVVTALARPGQIVPVDSEHSALAQCLRGGASEEVRRLVLTASGGPFRGRTREQLAEVTPEEALNHPTWDMGPVVTINSATLVNKGLEVIEAHLLFDIPFDRIEVVVHPTSVVHSMVEFTDGSTLAQASPPTMLIPIALGLAWPDRVADTAPPVDWSTPRRGSSSRSTTRPSPPYASPARPGSAAAPRRPSTTRPTRCAWRPSARAGWPSSTSSTRSITVLNSHDVGSGRDLTVDDVLAADAWARTRALDQLKETTA